MYSTPAHIQVPSISRQKKGRSLYRGHVKNKEKEWQIRLVPMNKEMLQLKTLTVYKAEQYTCHTAPKRCNSANYIYLAIPALILSCSSFTVASGERSMVTRS